MADERAEHLFRAAMGLAASMVQSASSVDQLLVLAAGDRSALEAARDRAETAATEEARRTEGVGSDEIPEARARVAGQLLNQALEEHDHQGQADS